MKKLIFVTLLLAMAAHAQTPDWLAGLGQGYDGEWSHATRQITALADTIPAEKYTWRPGPGVRSTGEVILHIATANFYLLRVAGYKIPAEVENLNVADTAKDKAKTIDWLKRSFDAVEQARKAATPADLQRKTTLFKHDVTVEGLYLRILVHANEHMGQLVAYARMNNIVPPWSKDEK